MDYHRDMKFSTFDQDNDQGVQNCAAHHVGGFWYTACFAVNFNGIYGDPWPNGICLFQRNTLAKNCSVEAMDMKIKPL